ncbi:hypothetical protein [Pseudomonas aeruginosa]|uniref:hypothetical protein n=1 Tax=Pseudomonas aeruginosa TaxID=287 RepID=UPI0002FAA8B7|nr:hypothetical protein [Pseudomonas aeruginosa]EKW1600965.1 hypothetical protein [Pseudomonas aeruginosa]ELJ2659111.1 hypothetical protein [Pseudomonas aeruginosa]KSM52857.1 hypothetical protein APA69_15580 [Pseudomonas aeruginosa]MBA5357289.1 hypothetical protein [Pseudomonas aeruginosa]MBG7507585.1 hypothetical protein [Pseudomonas aeruginosa]
MNKPTIEELLLQILSTCLLIDSQGKWKATFYLSCIDADVSVSIYRADDTTPLGDRVAHAYEYAFIGADTRGRRRNLTEDESRQNLSMLLTFTQRYLSMEAAA